MRTRVAELVVRAMARPDVQASDMAVQTISGRKATALNKTVIAKIAARATAASMRLENRAVPAGHIRSDGVKALLAERQARKR